MCNLRKRRSVPRTRRWLCSRLKLIFSPRFLNQVRIDLEHTKITAPVDGTVIARKMDVGQTIAASFQAPTIFEIAQDLTKMQVDTNIAESDIGHIHVGQLATFIVDAYPGVVFEGRSRKFGMPRSMCRT